MTTQVVIGTLVMTDGTQIPLRNDSLTDSSTSQEVQTDAAFTVVAQSVGDYAPGKTISHALISSKTHISWCYLNRQGLVAALLPIASRTAGGSGDASGALPLCSGITLQPGDKVLTYTEA